MTRDGRRRGSHGPHRVSSCDQERAPWCWTRNNRPPRRRTGGWAFRKKVDNTAYLPQLLSATISPANNPVVPRRIIISKERGKVGAGGGPGMWGEGSKAKECRWRGGSPCSGIRGNWVGVGVCCSVLPMTLGPMATSGIGDLGAGADAKLIAIMKTLLFRDQPCVEERAKQRANGAPRSGLLSAHGWGVRRERRSTTGRPPSVGFRIRWIGPVACFLLREKVDVMFTLAKRERV